VDYTRLSFWFAGIQQIDLNPVHLEHGGHGIFPWTASLSCNSLASLIQTVAIN